jgi:hypothetical protein
MFNQAQLNWVQSDGMGAPPGLADANHFWEQHFKMPNGLLGLVEGQNKPLVDTSGVAEMKSFNLGVGVNLKAQLAQAPVPSPSRQAPPPTPPAGGGSAGSAVSPAPAQAPASPQSASSPAPAASTSKPEKTVVAKKTAAGSASGSHQVALDPKDTTETSKKNWMDYVKDGVFTPTTGGPHSYGSMGTPIASLQNGLLAANEANDKSGFLDGTFETGQANDSKLGTNTQKAFGELKDRLAKKLNVDVKTIGGAGNVPDAKFAETLQSYSDKKKHDPNFTPDKVIDAFIAGSLKTDVVSKSVSTGNGNGSGEGTVHDYGHAPKDPKDSGAEVKNPPPSPQAPAAESTSTDWAATAQSAKATFDKRNDPVANNILNALGEDSGAGELGDATKTAVVNALIANKDNSAAMASLLADRNFYKGTSVGQVAAVKLAVTDNFKKLDGPGQRDLLAALYNSDADKAKVLTQLPSTSGFAKISGSSEWEGKFRKTILSGANQEVVDNLKKGGDMPAFAYTPSAHWGQNNTVNALLLSKAQALGPNAGELQKVTSVQGFASADPVVQSALIRGTGQFDASTMTVGVETLSGDKANLVSDAKFWAMLPGDQAKFAAAVSRDVAEGSTLTEIYPGVAKILASNSYKRMNEADRATTFANLMSVTDKAALGPMAGQVQQGRVPTLS